MKNIGYPIRNALGLFRSAILSGEPWTHECDAALDAAKKHLDDLGDEIASLETALDAQRAISERLQKEKLPTKNTAQSDCEHLGGVTMMGAKVYCVVCGTFLEDQSEGRNELDRA